MLDEAAQELFGTESHQPLLVAASVIFPAKRDLASFVSDQPMVANGNAMSVAAEITEDRLGAAGGGLGVTTQSWRRSVCTNVANFFGVAKASALKWSFFRRKARRSPRMNLRRQTRPRTLTGRKKAYLG